MLRQKCTYRKDIETHKKSKKAAKKQNKKTKKKQKKKKNRTKVCSLTKASKS